MANSKAKDSKMAGIYMKGHYVFYKDDLPNTNPQFAGAVMKNLANIDSSRETHFSDYAGKLEAIARAEASKETQFIKEMLGENLQISEDFWMQGGVEKIVKAINTIFQYKGVLERDLRRINEQLGHVSIYSDFGNYLAVDIARNTDMLADLLTTYKDAEKAVDVYVRKVFEEITLPRVLVDSGGKVGEGPDNAYLQFYKDLTEARRQSELFDQLAGTLGLDSLKEYLLKNVGRALKTSDIIKNSKINTTTARGESHEIFSAMAERILLEGFGATANVKVTGSKNAKADVTTVVNSEIEMPDLSKVFGGDESLRKRAKEAYEKFYEKTSKMDKGFIIYENAKSYASHKGEGIGRFSAGSPISLDVYKEVSNINWGLITLLMNLIPGALADGYMDDARVAIATTVANFLFDDMQAIGEAYSTGIGATQRSLHVLNLSGIYVPLSVFLHYLAEAIGSADHKYVKYADVTVRTPKEVLYPYSKNRELYSGEESTMPLWNEQREVAMDEITIQVEFWRRMQTDFKRMGLIS